MTHGIESQSTLSGIFQVSEKELSNLITVGWTLSFLSSSFSRDSPSPYTPQPPYPSGDFNADGYNYDVSQHAGFLAGNKSTSRSRFSQRGVFAVSDFPLPAMGTEGNLAEIPTMGQAWRTLTLPAERLFRLPFLGEAGSFQVAGRDSQSLQQG